MDIFDEDVPLGSAPKVSADITVIFDEGVPLAAVPRTGDEFTLWLTVNALSGTVLAGVSFLYRKKRNDEE